MEESRAGGLTWGKGRVLGAGGLENQPDYGRRCGDGVERPSRTKVVKERKQKVLGKVPTSRLSGHEATWGP